MAVSRRQAISGLVVSVMGVRSIAMDRANRSKCQERVAAKPKTWVCSGAITCSPGDPLKKETCKDIPVSGDAAGTEGEARANYFEEVGKRLNENPNICGEACSIGIELPKCVSTFKGECSCCEPHQVDCQVTFKPCEGPCLTIPVPGSGHTKVGARINMRKNARSIAKGAKWKIVDIDCDPKC